MEDDDWKVSAYCLVGIGCVVLCFVAALAGVYRGRQQQVTMVRMAETGGNDVATHQAKQTTTG